MVKSVERNYTFKDGKTLCLGRRTLVMGILNVTPDSFSDGGKWNNLENARYHMEQMIEAGADIIDIGAESTRPGAHHLLPDEEMKRLKPFLEMLVPICPVPISVDTFHGETARMAAAMGVHILNDIWGLQYEGDDGLMAKTAAEYGLPVIIMHNRDNPDTSGDIIESITDFFRKSFEIAEKSGIDKNNLILDPGIGFGKTMNQNMIVLKRLKELKKWDSKRYPILLGTSRKSFIGHALGLPVEERMEATGATCVMGIISGADIVRVHDVKPVSRMCRMTDAVLEAD
ncbi:MAG: dihydropteroate synthase [Butyrivibrio sp.]|nr:dihydropteroate synthase [Butyrivibrio sp.]